MSKNDDNYINYVSQLESALDLVAIDDKSLYLAIKNTIAGIASDFDGVNGEYMPSMSALRSFDILQALVDDRLMNEPIIEPIEDTKDEDENEGDFEVVSDTPKDEEVDDTIPED